MRFQWAYLKYWYTEAESAESVGNVSQMFSKFVYVADSHYSLAAQAAVEE